ncbi:cysteine desulfurase family protein [Cyanobium sp. NIES-981]|uniref:cysteine desulfurase family protein n=1 Tax=Cyanobium sp. NIES-981 TaxID=1851505 RepID=UPI0007DD181C|nr:cysteine desulfurase family protein [Cyanobium sp. NIES-981]SBO42241.1 Cysteine desulfurase [Cyanobium sp. NIES-981]
MAEQRRAAVPSALPLYLDACATAPPAPEVLDVMAAVQREAWANPSSLHGFGLQAAEALERARRLAARCLGCDPAALVFTSGGTEAIHTALLGAAALLPVGRLLITAVEHPATLAAAAVLAQRGWRIVEAPVDTAGLLDLESFEALLAPPTRLVSVIWGQSEVGTVQPLQAIGSLCRRAGVILHVDAVQVVGHRPVAFDELPVDLLSCAAHKLQGPRGVGALLVRPGLPFAPLLPGGGQEGGRRGGTEPVALVAGFAAALELAVERLRDRGGEDPLGPLRDSLLRQLLQRPGLRLSGVDPLGSPGQRLPHHISLLVSDRHGRPLSGRRLVQALWRQGVAISSGSACSSGVGAATGGAAPSAVLTAMGYPREEAASGIRLSLGPWLEPAALGGVAGLLERAMDDLEAGAVATAQPDQAAG